VTVCAEQALEQARAPRPGPFSGVPLPIKDLTDTEGIRTTRSSRAFAEHVPDFDAAVVRRLRAAGFLVIGKTNTPEFGLIPLTHSELNGTCRNPWDLSRTPGGSSGGAGAAIAAGLAPAAHGSDGGGSIRIPASCCGLYGLKPSRGRVSPAPYGDLYGLSSSGSITRTVADTAALLDVMAGNEPGDPYLCPPPERPFAHEVGAEPGQLRIAVTTTPPLDAEVDPACATAAGEAAELLASLGHELVEASPPWRSEELMELFTVVWQTIPPLYGAEARAQFGPMAAALADAADAVSSPDYLLAVARLQGLARQVVSFWNDFDLVLTPTLALPPPPADWLADADPWTQFREHGRFTPFTPIVNLTGQPAASLPLHWSDGGLPVGVQLIGRPGDEATILRVSGQLEQARPWIDRRPPQVSGQNEAARHPA
jgi:amidase